jgi:type VI secretion system protein ImpE
MVTHATPAEQSLRAGRPEDALIQLQDQVRRDPANVQYRTFLFQLLCVLGDWERARVQLGTLRDLDPGALAMAHVYGAAVTCELLRRDVVAGARLPLVLGEPLPWLALLLQALSAEARGASAQASALREEAREQAPAVPGTIDDDAFEWIADADSRFGPVCEAIIDGSYYWVPFERMSTITLEPASSLRDIVWMPAQLRFANGGEAAALLPARYPGSESDTDGLIRLGRKTEWLEIAADTFHGRGQRMLATETGVYPLLDVRRIELRGTAA